MPRLLSSGERSLVREELSTPDAAVVIVLAGRLEVSKGHAILLDALGAVRDLPGWILWQVGGVQRPSEQEYLVSLRARAQRLGIAERVRFAGQRADMPLVLASADIQCQPNTGPESFGLAFVEALAVGLPVVSTRLGGAIEIVDDSCGVLVPPETAERWRRRCVSSSPTRRGVWRWRRRHPIAPGICAIPPFNCTRFIAR